MISSAERIIVSNGSHSSLEEEKDERLSTSSGEGSSKSAVSRGSSSASSSSLSSKKDSKKNKASSKKDNRDPQRFLGEGVVFKAKLIGVRDVAQPRGEKMAQDALQELKTQKKTSGDHKQKVVVNISLEGLKIKDEKTKMVLYLHPVHKISFISQDASDNRAFGYIYGSPDNKHTFFAVKTEKAAQQVVMCMRDLFQIAYELKKDEIVLFRQQQQQQQQQANDTEFSSQSLSTAGDCQLNSSSPTNSSSCSSPKLSSESEESSPKIVTPCILVDFGSEVPRSESKLEVNAPVTAADMLGPIEDGAPNNDPFFSDPWGYLSSMSSDTATKLVKNDLFGLEGQATAMAFGWSTSLSAPSFSSSDPFNTSFVNVPSVPFVALTSVPAIPDNADPVPDTSSVASASDLFVDDRYAALAEIATVLPDTPNSAGGVLSASNASSFATEVGSKTDFPVSSTPFSSVKVCSELEVMTGPFDDQFVVAPSSSPSGHCPQAQVLSTASIFSDLDPLGKDRPYIDKKDFFYDLKNPPKKVLKDLIAENSFGSSGSVDFGVAVPQTPSPSPSQASSDDDLVSPPPSNAPPPLPPPFHRRISTVSPTLSLEDAVMASATPSPTSDVLLLPPPPPPPPRPYFSSLPPPPPVPMRQVTGGESGEAGTPFLLSSPPIPIPNRRSKVSVRSTPSSSSSSSSSSASVHPNANYVVPSSATVNAAVTQDPNNNPDLWVPLMPCPDQMTSRSIRPNNRETSQNAFNANSRNVFALDILSGPPVPPLSSGQWRNCTLHNRSLQGKLGASELGDKCDIFRKENDPFADDDFFAALHSGNRSTFNRANNHVWNASFNDNQ